MPRSLGDSARALLTICLNANPSDKLLIISDSASMRKALALKHVAEKMNCKTKFIRLTPIELEAKNFPLLVANEMCLTEITVACLNSDVVQDYARGEVRRRACEAGSRVAFLPSKLSDMPDEANLLLMSKRASRLAEILSHSRAAEIETGDGQTLRVVVEGRKASSITSLITEPGSWGILFGHSSTEIAPVEDMSEGEVVVDSSGLSKVGKAKEPVHLKFSRGRLVNVVGGKEADDLRFALAGVDFNAKVLGTIGFGTNHLSRRGSKQTIEDRNVLGTLSIGLGGNRHLNGKNASSVYVEVYAGKPTLRVDGKEIIAAGEMKIHLKDL